MDRYAGVVIVILVLIYLLGKGLWVVAGILLYKLWIWLLAKIKKSGLPTILRYLLAILASPVVGNGFVAAGGAIFFGIFNGAHPDPRFVESLGAAFYGAFTGYLAGLTARHRGVIVASIAQFWPLVTLLVLELSLNRRLVTENSAITPGSWIWIGMAPALIMGYYSSRRENVVASGVA
jgi:hypothetical protein